MKNYLFLCIFFLIISCTNNKSVYWCGDHPCINKKEKEAYFKKTMIVEVRELKKDNSKDISEYEKLTRKMPYSPFVEEAKFKICEAYKIESPEYYHDQTYTNKALDRYQEFLDDYPESKYKNEVLTSMKYMREKLSQKVFETGILYMKMDEFESARLVFEEISNLYYDTEMIDDSRLWIIKAYARDLDIKNAKIHLNKFKTELKLSDLYLEAENEILKAQKIIEKKDI